jgi:DNA-binding NtrC family response regulator
MQTGEAMTENELFEIAARVALEKGRTFDVIQDIARAATVRAALELDKGNKTRAIRRLRIGRTTLERILSCRLSHLFKLG